jgi:hypothetical protein
MYHKMARAAWLLACSLALVAGCSSDDEGGLSDHVVVVGSTENASGDKDWWIKKFSSTGVEDTANWDKTFDASGSDDEALSVAVDSQNHVYVSGYRGDSSGGTLWWIKKFSPDGIEDTANWDKSFGGALGSPIAYAVGVDSSDRVYVVGQSDQSSSAMWIKKFENDGVEITSGWDWQFAGGAALSVAFDSDNDVYVAGTKSSATTGGSDLWIKKFTKNGVAVAGIWDKVIDGGADGGAVSVAANSQDKIFVLGSLFPEANYDWLIKKYAQGGVEETAGWDKTVQGAANDQAHSLAIDSDDNVYAVGNTLGPGDAMVDWWLKKYDSAGVEDTTNWDKIIDGNNGHPTNYGKNDDPRCVAVNSMDSVYVVGSRHAGLHTDWWIKKFNHNGIEITNGWNKIIDGGIEEDDVAHSIAVFH